MSRFRTSPRLAAPLRAALAPPGAFLLPFLMLPLLFGAIWLWFDAEEMVAPGHLPVAFAAIALSWYLLGGALSLGRWRQAVLARRLLRARVPSLQAQSGQIWASDPSGQVLWQNDAASAAHGDRLGSAVSTPLARLSADPAQVIDALRIRVAGGGVASTRLPGGSLTLQSLDSDALQIWQFAPFDAAAEAPVVPSVEAPALHGCPEKDLFDRLPAALLRITANGRIAEANAPALALMGSIPEDATLSLLLDGLGRPVDDWVDDVIHSRIEARPEVLRRRAGADLHLQVALSPDGHGGVLAMLSDASAMKTLEAQFVQSQKMQAIGQLAGGIAHDFNNLLTAISGHCDLLMLHHDAADPDYSDLDQIRQNANRAAALVGQLLAFSRKQTLKPRLIDLRETLSDLTHLLSRLVGERVRLTFEHDADLRPIRADRRQFEQVLINLVVNARDAMPAGGRITIRTTNVVRGADCKRTQLPLGDYVRVTVEDEGCGIPADKLDKIFEPFFTTKRTGEGTGLGLSTVYGIVKQTGGYVFCDSAPDRGTVFSLYFPAHEIADLHAATEAEAAEREAAAPPLVKQAHAGVVLLVEDETAVRSFAARALRMRGSRCWRPTVPNRPCNCLPAPSARSTCS
ncbi:two-component system sensor histidine kinase NtrB [Paracoccus suum]|uniref:two-component system sensor histidine kinase NtrB n=1 Tax=Paracoccus suum TaxID=2259340 RepID=UPI00267C46E1